MIEWEATGKMAPASDLKKVLQALELDAYIVYVCEVLERVPRISGTYGIGW